jgi:hypothetical protein
MAGTSREFPKFFPHRPTFIRSPEILKRKASKHYTVNEPSVESLPDRMSCLVFGSAKSLLQSPAPSGSKLPYPDIRLTCTIRISLAAPGKSDPFVLPRRSFSPTFG